MVNQESRTEQQLAFDTMIKGLFASLDSNGDGELSRAELHRAAIQLGWHWAEAPLYALLDLLTVRGPITMGRFIDCMQMVQNDPVGPYGRVLREARVAAVTGQAKPRDLHSAQNRRYRKPPFGVQEVFSTGKAEDPIVRRIAQTSGAEAARAYQTTRAGLDTIRLTANNTAVLMIDPQRAFTHGAWMKSIGAGGARDVVPIQIAFDHCKTFVRHYYGQIEMMFTRCPFPPASYGWDEGLAKILNRDQIYLLKPGNSVFFPPTNGFREWMAQQITAGMRTLVIGGCTLNSCVRVSATETQRHFETENVQVVVDWNLSGARACNYIASVQYKGLSAVEDAVAQMQAAGVKVVKHITWR